MWYVDILLENYDTEIIMWNLWCRCFICLLEYLIEYPVEIPHCKHYVLFFNKILRKEVKLRENSTDFPHVS